MVSGMNTNNLERTNSVIWSLLGKSKYHGTRRTHIAVLLALFRMEDGKQSVAKLGEALGILSDDDKNK